MENRKMENGYLVRQVYQEEKKLFTIIPFSCFSIFPNANHQNLKFLILNILLRTEHSGLLSCYKLVFLLNLTDEK